MYGKSESQVTLASARDTGGGGKEHKVNIEYVLIRWVLVAFLKKI